MLSDAVSHRVPVDQHEAVGHFTGQGSIGETNLRQQPTQDVGPMLQGVRKFFGFECSSFAGTLRSS
jgi:hypothetical protein